MTVTTELTATTKRRAFWLEKMQAEAWEEAKRRKTSTKTAETLTKYIDDPVGFGEDVLGETFTDDVKAVLESVRDFPITVAQSCNASGKSHCAARAAAHFFKVYEDAKIYMTAAPPFDNLKKILWAELAGIAAKHPHIFEGDMVRAMDIIRGPQSFVTGVAIPMSGKAEDRETKFSGKHAPHLMFVIDEGDAVPEEVYRGIESCMSGGHTRMLIMFNPKKKSGYVYELIKNKRANVVHLSAFSHPNVITGENVIPGAVDRNVTMRRIHEWTRPLLDHEKRGADCFEVPDFLVGEICLSTSGKPYPPMLGGWRMVIEPAFSYMVMGVYPAAGAMTLISETWLERARANWDMYVAKFGETAPAGIRPRLGLDVAELGNDWNVCCLRWGSWVPRWSSTTMWNGLDPDETAVKVYGIYVDHDVEIAYTDGTGIGSSVAPSMARMGRKEKNVIRAVSVKSSAKPSPFITSELGEFKMMRDQLWWAMREWLRTDTNACLPPDPYLLDDLRAAEYEVIGDKIKIMDKPTFREKLLRSPDRGDSLALTFSPYERPKIIKLAL